jgi:hypothetical protein
MRNSLGFVLALLLSSGLASADQGRTEIGPSETFPIVIDTPGSYVLTVDLHLTTDDTTVIEITADNVDLDLGGHLIRGPGASSVEGIGIHGANVSGVSIHNGSITEIAEGIRLDGSAGFTGANRLSDLTVSHCGLEGVSIHGGTARDLIVHDVGMAGMSGDGFVCTDCSISNVTVRASFYGIFILRGTAENCTAVDNTHSGFTLRGASLVGGAAIQNGGSGIDASFGSVISTTVVRGNTGWGISMGEDNNCNVVNSTGYNNGSGSIRNCGVGNGCHQNYLP